MIIWTGLGFLVFVIVFGMSLLFNLAFDAAYGEGYYVAHRWTFVISLYVSAIVCWFLGLALRARSSRTLIDKETGQEVVLNRNNHTFFFIPMHLWGPLLILIGCVVLVTRLVKGEAI